MTQQINNCNNSWEILLMIKSRLRRGEDISVTELDYLRAQGEKSMLALAMLIALNEYPQTEVVIIIEMMRSHFRSINIENSELLAISEIIDLFPPQYQHVSIYNELYHLFPNELLALNLKRSIEANDLISDDEFKLSYDKLKTRSCVIDKKLSIRYSV